MSNSKMSEIKKRKQERKIQREKWEKSEKKRMEKTNLVGGGEWNENHIEEYEWTNEKNLWREH